MIRGLIGKKIGMTQIFDNDGNVLPVTLIEAGPCTVLELKDTPLKVKLGFDPIKENRVNKPKLGYFKKLKLSPMRTIKEFSSTDNKDYKVGQQLKADVFKPGDYVDVTGVSIGKGFQGGMKRWGWSGGPSGHGSMHHRRVGSIGASADPSRTFRGRKMPGHMGTNSITVQGLRVLEVDVDKNLLMIKGAIPGHRNSTISLSRSLKKEYKSLEEKKAIVVHKVNPMKHGKTKQTGKGKIKGN